MRAPIVIACLLIAAATNCLGAATPPDPLGKAQLALRQHQYQEAARLLAPPADAGDATAQYLLGLI